MRMREGRVGRECGSGWWPWLVRREVGYEWGRGRVLDEGGVLDGSVISVGGVLA